VQGLERCDSIERRGGGTARCTVPAAVWLRHGGLGDLECSHGSGLEPAVTVESVTPGDT
jgi:hypothetical protein